MNPQELGPEDEALGAGEGRRSPTSTQMSSDEAQGRACSCSAPVYKAKCRSRP